MAEGVELVIVLSAGVERRLDSEERYVVKLFRGADMVDDTAELEGELEDKRRLDNDESRVVELFRDEY